ncbi:MAG TPA: pilus assembly PilX N-terminal domain-containing protein [Vicinamibacterales bacterium]|jgi:Tfp pilus assembly protein PilX
MRRSPVISAKHTQRGAALVVGMLLLLVLTLLAISGMNTASLELAMAGNAQYSQNAFQAAEAGVETAFRTATLNPSAVPQRIPLTDNTYTTMPNTGGNDTFFSVTTPAQGGAALPALWGSTWDSFSSFHFEVLSTGRSVRNAIAVNRQGVAVIAPHDPTVTPLNPTSPALTP